MNIFPSYTPVGEIRAAAILTGSYVVASTFGDSTGMQTGVNPQPERTNNESTELILDYTYTKGDLTSVEIKIEFSTTGKTGEWFQEQSEATTAGNSILSNRLHQLTGAATARMGTFAITMTHPWVRVSAIGTGTATSSSLALSAHFIRKL